MTQNTMDPNRSMDPSSSMHRKSSMDPNSSMDPKSSMDLKTSAAPQRPRNPETSNSLIHSWSCQIWGFPKVQEPLSGSSYHKGHSHSHSILGSVLKPPICGNLHLSHGRYRPSVLYGSRSAVGRPMAEARGLRIAISGRCAGICS